MRFTVPQFIEHEAKIVGPLTFKQFMFFGMAGAIGVILRFLLPRAVFLPLAVILGVVAFALAFLKIGGIPFPIILANSLKFLFAPKIYIWRKEQSKKVEIFQKEQKMTEAKEDELPLKIAGKSQLKKIHTRVETATK